MKIYTRQGDNGQTGLFGGGRVEKSHPRVTAYGEVDELNAVLGVARATEPREMEDSLLESIQRDLFAIGAQLATPGDYTTGARREKTAIPEDRVKTFESLLDAWDEELTPLRSFVLPGGTPKAAALHLARTVCRRAERATVALAAAEAVSPQILVYLNRLSDLLFSLARLANHRGAAPDQTW